jgi:hypothetical protein
MTTLTPGAPSIPADTAADLAPRLAVRLHNHTWAAQLADATGLDVYVASLASGRLAVIARMPGDEQRTGPHLRITGRDGGLPLTTDGTFWDGVRVQSFTPGTALATVEAGTTWEPFGLSQAAALTVAVRSVLVTWRRDQEATRP